MLTKPSYVYDALEKAIHRPWNHEDVILYAGIGKAQVAEFFCPLPFPDTDCDPLESHSWCTPKDDHLIENRFACFFVRRAEFPQTFRITKDMQPFLCLGHEKALDLASDEAIDITFLDMVYAMFKVELDHYLQAERYPFLSFCMSLIEEDDPVSAIREVFNEPVSKVLYRHLVSHTLSEMKAQMVKLYDEAKKNAFVVGLGSQFVSRVFDNTYEYWGFNQYSSGFFGTNGICLSDVVRLFPAADAAKKTLEKLLVS